jgi:hypothetical protein
VPLPAQCLRHVAQEGEDFVCWRGARRMGQLPQTLRGACRARRGAKGKVDRLGDDGKNPHECYGTVQIMLHCVTSREEPIEAIPARCTHPATPLPWPVFYGLPVASIARPDAYGLRTVAKALSAVRFPLNGPKTQRERGESLETSEADAGPYHIWHPGSRPPRARRPARIAPCSPAVQTERARPLSGAAPAVVSSRPRP